MALLARSILAIGLFAGLASVALADSFTFATISDPLAFITIATGINDAGLIVGYYVALDGSGYHGFVDNGGNFTTIDDPLGAGTSVPGFQLTSGTTISGINDAGQIVGDYYDESGQHGYLDNGGIFTTIDDPLGTSGTDVSGINDGGQIVGNFSSESGTQPFVYNDGTFTTINSPFTGTIFANGINDTGQIVGYYFGLDEMSHGFVDTGGAFTTIDDPSATAGTALSGINDTGQMVGKYFDVNGSEPFLDNRGAFTTLSDPNAPPVTINGINDEGQIVGYDDFANGFSGFVATPTASPEPSTLTMAFAALLWIAGSIRAATSRPGVREPSLREGTKRRQ